MCTVKYYILKMFKIILYLKQVKMVIINKVKNYINHKLPNVT